MNIPIFILLLFLLQLLCLVISKKGATELKTQEDYFLAGRNIRFFPLLMTLVATQIGGGTVLGSAEEAYLYGWYVLLYPLGVSLGLIVLAAGIGKRLSQLDVPTVAQLFETTYRSPGLKRIASLLSIVSLFMILIAQMIASRKFMISLGVDQTSLFVAFWGIVILYTVIGGFKAVVTTDLIQAIFFICVFLLCFAYTLFSGSSAVTSVVNAVDFDFDFSKLTGWLLMPLLFMVIEQDMAQRCFAAKSGRVVSWASGCAAACIMLVCAIPVYYGIVARQIGLELPEGSSVFMSVIQATTNPILTAFVGCAILAAIISTADSLINAISSNVAQDFDYGKRSIRTSQGIAFLIGCSALVGSFYWSSIVGILIQSYELSVSCLFVPIVVALFRKEGNSTSATYAVALGAIGFVAFRFLPLGPVPRELASLLLSAGGFLVGELLQSRLGLRFAVNFNQRDSETQ